MKKCPFCAEQIQDAAIKCRYCGSLLETPALSGDWYRKRQGKMIAGVCAGLAEQFGISVTVLRLVLILLTLFGFGGGFIVYCTLWVIMPYEPRRLLQARRGMELSGSSAGRVEDERRAGELP